MKRLCVCLFVCLFVPILLTNASIFIIITKTCPCNVYHLNPTFIKQNWGMQGYTYFFLFLLQNIDYGYSCTHTSVPTIKRVPTIYVLSKNKKNIRIFLLKIFIFDNFKNLCILHGRVFVMCIGASFPASKSEATFSSSEESIFFILTNGTCYMCLCEPPCPKNVKRILNTLCFYVNPAT